MPSRQPQHGERVCKTDHDEAEALAVLAGALDRIHRLKVLRFDGDVVYGDIIEAQLSRVVEQA